MYLHAFIFLCADTCIYYIHKFFWSPLCRSQFFYSCGRNSPIWAVTKGAKSAGERTRTLQLAAHRNPVKEFQGARQIETIIPAPALSATASERLQALAAPKNRSEGPFREPTWPVRVYSQNTCIFVVPNLVAQLFFKMWPIYTYYYLSISISHLIQGSTLYNFFCKRDSGYMYLRFFLEVSRDCKRVLVNFFGYKVHNYCFCR